MTGQRVTSLKRTVESPEPDARTAPPAPAGEPQALYQPATWSDRPGLLPPEPISTPPLSGTRRRAPRQTRLHYGSWSVVPPNPYQRALLDVAGPSLCWVAGFVDAAGFLTLVGLFPAHVTGELVSAASAAWTQHHLGLVGRLALIGVFFWAVAVSVLLARGARRLGRSPLAPLLALVTIGLSVFCLVGSSWHRTGPVGQLQSRVVTLSIASGAVFAMGVQNALMRQALLGALPTTVMTGNITQLITDLIDLGLQRKSQTSVGERNRLSLRLRRLCGVITAFFAGAAAGGWLTHRLGPVCVVLPTLMCAALTLLAWRLTWRGVSDSTR